MKKMVLALCIPLYFGGEVMAQQDYTIRFGVYNYADSLFEKNKSAYFIRNDFLFTNGDSVSFYCLAQQSGNYPKGTIGQKKFHHAVYTFPLLYKHLDVNAWTRPYNLPESDTKIFNWTILNDTRIIKGFTCQLAVSENKNERAWFTKEIPISSGPSVYNGLPGLILRLEEYGYYRTFEAEVIKKESPKIVLTDLPIKECKHCVSKAEKIKAYFLH